MIKATLPSNRSVMVSSSRPHGFMRPVALAVPFALALAGCGDGASATPSHSTSSTGGAAGANTTGGISGSTASAEAGSGTTAGDVGSGGATAGSGQGGSGGTTVGSGQGASGGSVAGNTSGGSAGGAPVVVYSIVGCTIGGSAAAAGAGGAEAGGAAGAGGASGPAGAGGAGGAGGGAGGVGGAGGGAAGGSAGGAGIGGTNPIFASFSVYDWVTDKPVPTCLDEVSNFNITVTGDAPLTVVANFGPGNAPGSVLFTYDGQIQLAQNKFPYALAPDENGDFSGPAMPLAPGPHTIGIAAYDQLDGTGNLLGQASVVLTVIGAAP